MKFEYPMMVVSGNRSIYERRFRQLRLGKAVDVSELSSGGTEGEE